MKFELSDGHSNHSDFSSDSQSSQGSTNNDFVNSTSTSMTRSAITLANLEGLNSGVPTRTTATLTPTRLRNIEQTFIELQCASEPSPSHAGFVPPPVALNNYGGSLRSSPGPIPYATGAGIPPQVSPGPGSSGSSSDGARPRRRHMGGRRPAKPHASLSPEEEERRKVRRERNKMAAARCRKRRLDHTNELQDETEELEVKKQSLQAEIRQLQQDSENLERILEKHRACCRLARAPSPPDVKPFTGPLPVALPADGVRVKVEAVDNVENVIDLESNIFTSPQTNKRIMLSSANPQVVTTSSPAVSTCTLNTPPINYKPNRPNSLNVALSMTPAQVHNIKNTAMLNDIMGIDITTPSNGIPFNFESLMEGGTGLTPVQPCATQQQRTIVPEVSSPDSVNNTKLVSL